MSKLFDKIGSLIHEINAIRLDLGRTKVTYYQESSLFNLFYLNENVPNGSELGNCISNKTYVGAKTFIVYLEAFLDAERSIKKDLQIQ